MKKNRKKPVEAYLKEIDQLWVEADKHCSECVLKRKKAKQILRRMLRARGRKHVE
jgi:hypothetical protein